MKPGNIIKFIAFLPFVFIFALWLLYRFYTPAEFLGAHEVKTEEFRLYGDDGITIMGEFNRPLGVNDPHFLFFISDYKLDRNWNSQALKFRTGERLKNIFSSRGVLTAGFDQRATGDSGGQNPLGRPNRLTADFILVFEKAVNLAGFRPGNFSILAHGDGCLLALKAVNRYKLKPANIFLTSCAFSGSLLESWTRRILENMRRARVKPSLLTQARHEADLWLMEKPFASTPPGTFGPFADMEKSAGDSSPRAEIHKDLAAFRNSLYTLQSKHNISWTRQAADLNFETELTLIMKNSRARIYHFLGTMDEEISAGAVNQVEDLAARLKNSKRRYRLISLPNTNHFLKLQPERSGGGLSTTWNRINPFLKLSPLFIKTVLEAIHTRAQ